MAKDSSKFLQWGKGEGPFTNKQWLENSETKARNSSFQSEESL